MEWLQVWRFLGLSVLITANQSTTTSPPLRQPSYVLLSPSFLCPGIPLSVSVTILTSSLVTVHAEIKHGNSSVASNKTTVNGGSTQLLTLPPVSLGEKGHWMPCQLTVTGYVGPHDILFTNSTYLPFNTMDLSTFIQTDKPNYRAGQTVKIRVVSIHPDGKPYKKPVNMVIKDPKGNVIRQWATLNGTMGVVSKELQLSENPPLGAWTIVTTVNVVVTEKYFQVTHYVLPKFGVMIEVPSVLYHEDSLFGTVTSKYTYGKSVQGYMNITFIHHFHGLEVASSEGKEIDGTADFEFDMSTYHDMYKRSKDMMDWDEYMDDDECLKVVVHVTDSKTGLTYNSTATVNLAKCRYKLRFHDYPVALRPSLNLTAEVQISTYNDEPLMLEDLGKLLRLSVMQFRRDPWNWMREEVGERLPLMPNVSDHRDPLTSTPGGPMFQEMVYPVPADGVMRLSIPIADDTEGVTIEASFEDGYETLHLHNSYLSPSQSYMQIQKPHAPPQVGIPLLLPIQSNFEISAIHYVVMSRGRIVAVGKALKFLLLTPEASWAPMACVVVYCVRPDGEVVNDVTMLKITQALENKVSVTWSKDKVRPADEVSLSLSVSEPGSLLGILVVDQATRWTESHNDITMERVLGELRKYSMGTGGHYDDMATADPFAIFMMCDLMVLTDATLKKWGDQMWHEYQHPSNIQHGLEPQERWDSPETWLWLDTNTGSSTTAEMTLTVPDSITTWVATAFVMSEDLGLGIAAAPVELKVFQDFYASLNLPAYIIRGEELLLEVNLFNYLAEDLEVMVTVAESEFFDFIFPDDTEIRMASSHSVFVRGQSGASVLFPIKPTALGEMSISVKAVSFVAMSFVTDTIRTVVLVKPEGLEKTYSKTCLMELHPTQTNLTKDISFTFPGDVVNGSERVQVTAVGDILGPSIKGLESLIQMPYGCGEQNMINFAPNIYVLQYLEVSGQSDPATVTKAESYMMKGYEQELSYQRDDGSFSAFGDHDTSGSTWLTAFVLRCFLQARPFISIDPPVLLGAATWLGAQQSPDGRYEEPGRVIHTELQGGLDGPISLTAYVLMALLEDSALKTQYDTQVYEALMYLETRLALGISSNYSLCLVTYALALSESSSAITALNMLLGRAQMRDGVPFWSSSDTGLSASWQPRSVDIEMAAYVLLSMHRLGQVVEGLSLMKWLSQQRSSLGGYGSTQDTVMALQALSKYAGLSGAQGLDLTIRVNLGPSNTVATFHIDPTNYMVHQSKMIDTGRDVELQVTGEGQGFALFQLNIFYNIDSKTLSRRRRDVGDAEAFYLAVELYDPEMHSAYLDICTRLMEGQGLSQTGMAIVEAGLLSGFSLAQYSVQTDDIIKKVETAPGKVILYLDSVTTMEMCFRIPLQEEYKVAKVQHTTVTIYDYYEPRRMTVRSYTSERRSQMSSCSFCGGDCGQCSGTQDEDEDVMSAAPCAGRCRPAAALLSPLLALLVFAGSA